MTSILRWGWLLGVALLAPVALPAGGGQFGRLQLQSGDGSGILLTGDSCALRTSPFAVAPILRTFEIGTPLRFLRCWQSADGAEWVQVEIRSHMSFGMARAVKRGWVNV